MSYYSGQGKVYVATRDAGGNPGGFRWLGNVPSLELSIETEKFEHKEAYTGNRAIDVTVVTETKATVTFTIEDFSVENLALGLYGENTVVSGAAGVAEVLYSCWNPIGGTARPLRVVNPNGLTVTTVKDITDTTTYVEDTDYTVDLTNGTITPIDTGAGVTSAGIVDGENLNIVYTHTGHTRTDVFTVTSKEVWLRFEGLSTLDSGETTLIDCFRVAVDPMTGYSLINEEMGSAELTGSILVDTTRATGNQYFQQINIPKV